MTEELGSRLEAMVVSPPRSVPGAAEEGTSPPPPSEALASERIASRSLASSFAESPESALQGGVESMVIELPSEDELVRRLVVLCIGDEGPPQTSSGKVPGLEATNTLIRLCISVVNKFFEERKVEIRWVTAKAQLDKTVKYVVNGKEGDALVPLLLSERPKLLG